MIDLRGFKQRSCRDGAFAKLRPKRWISKELGHEKTNDSTLLLSISIKIRFLIIEKSMLNALPMIEKNLKYSYFEFYFGRLCVIKV